MKEEGTEDYNKRKKQRTKRKGGLVSSVCDSEGG